MFVFIKKILLPQLHF